MRQAGSNRRPGRPISSSPGMKSEVNQSINQSINRRWGGRRGGGGVSSHHHPSCLFSSSLETIGRPTPKTPGLRHWSVLAFFPWGGGGRIRHSSRLDALQVTQCRGVCVCCVGEMGWVLVLTTTGISRQQGIDGWWCHLLIAPPSPPSQIPIPLRHGIAITSAPAKAVHNITQHNKTSTTTVPTRLPPPVCLTTRILCEARRHLGGRQPSSSAQ